MLRILLYGGAGGADEATRSVLKQLRGFPVTEVSSPESGLEALTRQGFDVLIFPEKVCEAERDAFLRIVEKKAIRIPVVVMTREGHEEILLRGGQRLSGIIGAGSQDTGNHLEVPGSDVDDKVQHVIRILLAIRKVNQIIAKERDVRSLLSGICEALVETRGFSGAWVVLIDESNRRVRAAEAGLGKEFLPILERMKGGEIPGCITRGLDSARVQTVHGGRECTDCPLAPTCTGKGILLARLEFGWEVYGVLSILSTPEMANDPAEKEIVREVARDIAYALHGLEVEAERVKAEAALLEANKKLQLLSSITRHDILNQITGISGYMSLLEDMITDDEQIIQYVERVKRYTEMIHEQISFTRDYQELGVERPEWFLLDSIVRDGAGSAIPAGTELSISCGTAEIWADPLFFRAFFNLVENSVRHGEGVTKIGVSFREEDRFGIITVEDNGCGIAESEKERIFRRGVGSNTGLGLFLVREIFAITGITIIECGKEGEGARFEITVPPDEWRWR